MHNPLAPEGPVIIRTLRADPGAIGAGAVVGTRGGLPGRRGALFGPCCMGLSRAGRLLNLRPVPRPEPGTRVETRTGAGSCPRRVRTGAALAAGFPRPGRRGEPPGWAGAVGGPAGLRPRGGPAAPEWTPQQPESPRVAAHNRIPGDRVKERWSGPMLGGTRPTDVPDRHRERR
ncbi:hypothetical protein NDU88_004647 [Pleurodeles waltl]|uniref:Uncharacterized protein n=1 Tax=Pleurodeles waltl TaxID=8319 RepID=A0AAV7PEP6_PLEWA|nr:hypothetical protein NDU88_004647 [Pleurodeles waltl]